MYAVSKGIASAVAVYSGERGRKKGRIGVACGGGGAMVLGWDRKGMEDLVGRCPWSFHGWPWRRAEQGERQK